MLLIFIAKYGFEEQGENVLNANILKISRIFGVLYFYIFVFNGAKFLAVYHIFTWRFCAFGTYI